MDKPKQLRQSICLVSYCLIGAYLSLNTGVVHHFINVISCDPRLELFCSYVEHLPRNLADLSHAILGFLVQDVYLILLNELVFWITVLPIIRMRYRFRDSPSWRQWIYRSQWTSEWIIRERIVKGIGLVYRFVF